MSHLPFFFSCPSFQILGSAGYGQLLSRFDASGLRVAVLAHERVPYGPAGKTQLALFEMGADSLYCSWRGEGDRLSEVLADRFAALDLVVEEVAVEGDSTLKELFGAEAVIATDSSSMSADPRRLEVAILERLDEHLRQTAVWACILIGGKSSRMGSPKHLLSDHNGVSWLERTMQVVAPLVSGVVVAGKGEVPDSLTACHRLADIPGAAGPLAGILAAMRWRPQVAWLVVACDMPGVDSAAIRWLLEQRTPGRWGVVPRLVPGIGVEPLFAIYEPRCRELFEGLYDRGESRIRLVADTAQVAVRQVPETLRSGWLNINTPEELNRFRD